MDYVGSVTYVAQDRDWLKKLGIGVLMGLLSFVLVGNWALYGWSMEAFRRVVRGSDEKLPGWDDLGGYIGQGLKYFVVSLVWSLPMIVIVAIVAGTAATASSYSVSAGEAAMVGMTLLLWLLAMLYAIAVGLLSMGAFVILAQTGNLGQALNPINAWNVLSRNLGKWVLTALALIVISVILSLIGSVLCGVGAFVAMPWLSATQGNLLGQTFVEAGAEL
ncbi:MAG: DUF4013 domain-containing protein [Anaerolineae bacterium]|jgi:hypothetical protein